MGISQRGEWAERLGFFLSGVKEQSIRSAKVVESLLLLRAKYARMFETERNAEKLLQAFDFLMGHPIASIRQVQDGIGMNDFKLASRYLKKLENMGIIREITGGSRNRLFRVDRIMKIIQE